MLPEHLLVKEVFSMMNNCFSADTSIGLLALSPPAYNALMRAGIRKIGDIAALTQEELAAIRNFPAASVNEILTILSECGLFLADHSTGGTAQFKTTSAEADSQDGFYIPTQDSVAKADAWLARAGNYDYLCGIASETGASLCYLAGKLPHFFDVLEAHKEGEERLRVRLREYALQLSEMW